MRLLALDTSTLTSSVALLSGDPADPGGARLLGEIEVQARPNHADTLMRQIESLLSLLGSGPADLDAVAVGAGPGSFTGLRIGYATAKGLCYARGCPLLAVPSLQALAQAARPLQGRVLSALDARRGEVYAAFYRAAGPGFPVVPDPGEPMAVTPERLADLLAERASSGPLYALGDGVHAHRRLLGERLGERLVVLPSPAAPPAAFVAELALGRLARGEVEELASATPLYVRPPDARPPREAPGPDAATAVVDAKPGG